ncbi:MAG: 30S ribosomal protein S9 [Anaerolineales bacterium]|nr:MAG: 30S ribosomal protein S9 [Anaerolineales bacterium]
MAQYYEGIGRRKRATCRVRIVKGSGSFVINEKTLAEYFPTERDTKTVTEPLNVLPGSRSDYDISAIVKGGGVIGQADSVRLGLARAMMKMDPELRTELSHGGFLSRDAREKERKKPGLKGARKAPTYTKR